MAVAISAAGITGEVTVIGMAVAIGTDIGIGEARGSMRGLLFAGAVGCAIGQR